jgi:quercetin dioxygenase-like cupin family protein
MKPGETHDWHDHQEDEVIYVIDGEGRYELKERTIEYKKDDFIFMPKKTMHKNITTGTKDVLLVAIFNPATE